MGDPLFGINWVLDKGQSKYSTEWSPDTETRVYEEIENGYKLTVSGMRNGKPYSWHYTARYDGNDHPVHGRPDIDSIQAYRINNLITLGFLKHVGQIGGEYARIVSEDRKTLTVIASGITSTGATYFDVVKYRRS